MPTLTYPGVYVQEVSSGVRPIEGASTSTPAFVGLAEMGPDDEARRITSWVEFQRIYGNFISTGRLAHSVFQFFNNGGRQCYIVRVTPPEAETASVTVMNRATPPIPGLTFSAKSKGAWGNFIYLQIQNGTNDPGNEFMITVRRQPIADILPEDPMDVVPLEIHDNLSMNENASNFVVNVLAENSNLITAEVLAANKGFQRGVHRGGAGPQLPTDTKRKFEINVDNDGFQVVTLDATPALTNLNELATAIQNKVKVLTKKKASTNADAFSRFTCQVEGTGEATQLVLKSGTNTLAGNQSSISSVRIQDFPNVTENAAGLLKLGATQGGLSEDASAAARPALPPDTALAIQIGDAVTNSAVATATPGEDGNPDQPPSFWSAAFARLDNITDVSLLAVPGENTPPMVDAGMNYCQNRPLQDMFYIGEVAERDNTPADAEVFRRALKRPNSYGAVYFPWIKALDPTGKSAEPILLPPSGFIAGLYARIDATRGVWKAPAGTEASLGGAVGLEIDLSDVQHGNLNPLNINVIRRFDTAGIVAFGARTITSDPEWKYVPVRRTAIMLRVSIYNGIQWAVFEPNDENLWSQLRLNITAFMMTLFRQGAFQGSTPSQAFFVKCDNQTTTQQDIDAGRVNVLVGFAPLKPSEFVVVTISQKAGQSS